MTKTSSKVTRMMRRNARREEEKKARKEYMASREEERKTKRNILNRKCNYESSEEEMQERQKVVAEALKVYRRYLPGILKDLSQIEDPRNPKKIEHKLTMLMLYGMLMFIFHIKSRREANREITKIVADNIREFFPEFDSLPHADTLARLLEKIDVMEIENAIIKLAKRLIADKKLERYKIFNRYVIVFDGTGKFSRDWEWCENCLERHKKGQPEGVNKYYAYALEASIALNNGLTIPLMTEFLERDDYSTYSDNEEKRKQDNEIKAFKKLATRLKKAFPNLKIAVTLDGLFANGPIMEMCKKFGWDFMITLKDGSLKTVWEDIRGLKRRDKIEKYAGATINGVKQEFLWINDVDYYYGDNDNKSIKLNVVACEETWVEIDKNTGLEVEKKGKFVWLSSRRLTERNVEKRCNFIGRPRWNIETQNLVEKHHGYSYQHCFSYNWEAMKGFHYLMHLGYIINTLTLYSTTMIGKVKELGVRGTVKLLWKTFSGCILDFKMINSVINTKYQIRLAI